MLKSDIPITTIPIIIVAFVILVLALLAFYIRRAVKDYTAREGKTDEEMPPEELFLFGPPNAIKDDDEDVPEDFEPPLEEVEVTVSGKRCGTRITGTKSVHAVKGFFITFRDSDGLEYDFQVEEDMYLSIAEGQKGSIAIVNGNLYGFCPDETE